MKKVWHDEAWEDYLKLQTDKKLLKKANALLKDIERGGYDGIGKPEPLKGNLSGYYSRRAECGYLSRIVISTRRFFFLPSSFMFEAAGIFEPKPWVKMCFFSRIFSSVRKSATVAARLSLSA